jgi:hypothetical protein
MDEEQEYLTPEEREAALAAEAQRIADEDAEKKRQDGFASFDALLKRAKALKNGDDIGLKTLAGTAIESHMTLPRLDALMRAAKKTTGFGFIAIRKVFDAVRVDLESQKQAEKQTDPSVAAADAAAQQAALEAQKTARKAEGERLWQACRDIALAPNLLNRMARHARQVGVIGEVSAIKGSYIAVTSRLMDSTAINLLRRGAPAGGKNFLFAHVTALIPEESLITVTSASATALVYFGNDEDSLKHKVILVAEAAAIAPSKNGDEHPAAVLLRSLLSEGHIDRLVTVTQSGAEPRAIRVRRNGPIALLVTSARDNIDAEMLTRLMVCDADESLAQTKAVIKQNWGQKWLTMVSNAEIETWRDFQRWLEFEAPYDVVVPFGAAIYDAFLDLIKRVPAALQLRMRRDSGCFLTAIKTSAVIHKAQRQTDNQGRIIAELADYRHAWSAFSLSMAGLYGVKVRPELIALVEAAEEIGTKIYDESALHGVDSTKITVGIMRRALGINSSDVAYNRMQEALDAGMLKQDEDRKGSGRGSPRYFWLLKTSQELKTGVQLGVFPAPSSVKKFLLSAPPLTDNGQDGTKGSEPTTPDPSYPSYPQSSDAPPCDDEKKATGTDPFIPSYPLSVDPPSQSKNFFNHDEGPANAAPQTAPVSENTQKSRKSAPSKSAPPEVIVAAARERGVIFDLAPERDLFTLEWRGPVDPLIDEAIRDNYEAILAYLIREAGS